MSERVFYVNYYGQPPFADRLAQAGEFELIGLTDHSSSAEIDAVLATSRVYQISSGENDVPPHLRANAALLARAPSLLLVSAVGAGYDTVDVAACTDAGVLVVNQAGGGNAQAVVEHTVAMMLSLAKHLHRADRDVRHKATISRHTYTGNNTHGKTLGLIGFGHVGRGLARVCRHGLDMRILVHDTRGQPAGLKEHGAEWAELDDLLREADYVVTCCSLTPRTKGMMGAEQFARMKPTAYFINTARGGIHQETALLRALEAGHLAGAGLDVWDIEPPPRDHPLLQRDDVMASPHIAGTTVESRYEAAVGAAEQILTVLAGKRPPRLLNPAAWPKFCERYRLTYGRMPLDA